jgi:hypothetical protein
MATFVSERAHVGYDAGRDVIVTYYPNSHDPKVLGEKTEEFTNLCYKHLTKAEDRKTLETFLKWSNNRYPVQAVITPGGHLRGGNIRIVDDGQLIKYGLLDDIHSILTDHDISHPDLRRLYSNKTCEEIRNMRDKLTEDLREAVKTIYKMGLLDFVVPDVMLNEKGLFVALPDLPHEEVRLVGELDNRQRTELGSRYQRLLTQLK